LEYPNQLALGMGRGLEMQTSQNPLAREGLVILNKIFADPVGRKKILAVALQKMSPGIAKNPGFNDEESREGAGLEIHNGW
jgi:hypothetical protein